ncbi:hypothetical protein QJS04_geneDACA023818 [Acorus gramineus]|uniref:Fe2OG dioxygenase domain-containing protein n=1 Tax=Acorus gramineus TaxID=55184 RepID=A0AAV9AKD6_ACOGR|nr:hypothetical protein QJS04_geneDACA023818 [Acorus gramineus]
MCSESPIQIPIFDLSGDIAGEQGSDTWNTLSRGVCEALESFGCAQLTYDGVPDHLCEDMFKVMERVFDLPDETKRRNTNDKPYFGHTGRNEFVPFYESLGVENSFEIEKAKVFTELLWPEGNDFFCETLNLVGAKMLELDHIIVKMIFDGLGVPKQPGPALSKSCNFRVMKYDPPSGPGPEVVLPAHTDKDTITVLCQQEGVQGLEVLVDGTGWVPVPPTKGCFVLIAGEMLKPWSNGRIKPVKHRVALGPGKERYSFGSFLLPEADGVIEAPKELVDGEARPALYRPFDFSGFLSHVKANITTSFSPDRVSVDVYAAL